MLTRQERSWIRRIQMSGTLYTLGSARCWGTLRDPEWDSDDCRCIESRRRKQYWLANLLKPRVWWEKGGKPALNGWLTGWDEELAGKWGRSACLIGRFWKPMTGFGKMGSLIWGVRALRSLWRKKDPPYTYIYILVENIYICIWGAFCRKRATIGEMGAGTRALSQMMDDKDPLIHPYIYILRSNIYI